MLKKKNTYFKLHLIVVLVYSALFIFSSLSSCLFFKLNESIAFVSCSLLFFFFSLLACIATIFLLTRKKKIIIHYVICIPVILFCLYCILWGSFTSIYLVTDLFQTEPFQPRKCNDGRKIPCTKNSDCEWQKLESFCYPEDVDYATVMCAPSIKCSPDNVCEDYCHPSKRRTNVAILPTTTPDSETNIDEITIKSQAEDFMPLDTTGWKTYSNDFYHYQFKYPSNFEVYDAGIQHCEGCSSKEFELVIVSKLKGQKTPSNGGLANFSSMSIERLEEKNVESLKSSKFDAVLNVDIQEEKIGNVKLERYKIYYNYGYRRPEDKITYFLKENGSTYHIILNTKDMDENDYLNIYKTIISTLRF